MEATDVRELRGIWWSFTWSSNRRDGNPLIRNLDHCYGNEEWLTYFPGYDVEFKTPGISYHNHIAIFLKNHIISVPKPFKYFEIWSTHESYKTRVEEAWATDCEGNELQRLQA